MTPQGSIPDNSAETTAANVVYLNGDPAIAIRLKDGDPDALRILYDRYAGYIRTILARLIGTDLGAVDDCLQETFTAAFCHARSIQDPRYLRTWLTRIAIHRAIDHLRRNRRESWLQFRAPESVPELGVSASHFEDKEALQAFYELLRLMPTKERVPFALRRMEQMSLMEVAEVTGVSLATTKRRLAAAQRRFESLVESCPTLKDWLGSNGNWRLS